MDASSPTQATYSSSLKRSSSRTISFRVRAQSTFVSSPAEGKSGMPAGITAQGLG